MVSATPTPHEIVAELVAVQGRKIRWLADRAGLNPATMNNLLNARPRYRWKPGQREAIAEALGVPLRYIWRDATDAPDPAAVTE